MTAEQEAVYAAIAAGPRGGVPLPFLAMLDTPKLAGAIQSVGEAIRFSSKLDDRLREIAILAAAAAWGSGYEWAYHEDIARRLGMTAADLSAVRDGSGVGLIAVEAAIVRFVFTAIREHRAGRDDLRCLVELLDRERATEVVAIAGYYPLLALFLSAGELDTPLPEITA